MAKTIRKSKGSQKMYVMKGCYKGVARPKTVRRPKGSRPKSVRPNKKSVRRRRQQQKSIGRGRSIGLAGGNCTTCQTFNGGSSTNALIGAPWSATDGQTQPPSNHYAQNMYKSDPQMMMEVRGGKGSRGQGTKGRRRLRLKGGSGLMSLVPADLVNLGRDLTFNASSAYSSLTGATQPVNPSVTEGQLQSSVNLNKIVV